MKTHYQRKTLVLAGSHMIMISKRFEVCSASVLVGGGGGGEGELDMRDKGTDPCCYQGSAVEGSHSLQPWGANSVCEETVDCRLGARQD